MPSECYFDQPLLFKDSRRIFLSFHQINFYLLIHEMFLSILFINPKNFINPCLRIFVRSCVEWQNSTEILIFPQRYLLHLYCDIFKLFSLPTWFVRQLSFFLLKKLFSSTLTYFKNSGLFFIIILCNILIVLFLWLKPRVLAYIEIHGKSISAKNGKPHYFFAIPTTASVVELFTNITLLICIEETKKIFWLKYT